MIGEIGGEGAVLDLAVGKIAGELVDHAAHHLEMTELLGADVRQKTFQLGIRHGKALAEIAQRCAQFSIRTTVLADDQRCQFGIGIFDPNRVLQLLFIDKHYWFPPFSHGQGSSSH